jgi:hypothetical protein
MLSKILALVGLDYGTLARLEFDQGSMRCTKGTVLFRHSSEITELLRGGHIARASIVVHKNGAVKIHGVQDAALQQRIRNILFS